MDSRAFFDQTVTLFTEAASKAGGVIEHNYIIGDRPVRLRFAGPALLPWLTPALAHLMSNAPAGPAGGAGPPSLTVHLWDSVSTHTSIPPPPWRPGDYGIGGEVHSLIGGPVQAVFQIGPAILTMYDREQRQAVYWVKSLDQFPFYEKAAPLRILLQQWGSAQGLLMVHAAAVGDAQGGVLLTGKGGSGKSNTALACLASDLLYAGDDFCLVDPDPEPTVYSLYNSGKTYPADMERLPFLASMVSNPAYLNTEKALYFVHAHYPHKIARRLPIRAILAPHVTRQRDTEVRPASPAEVLTALAPSTVILAPNAGRPIFHALGRLVRRLPCYHLDLGSDTTLIPSTLKRLIHALAA